MNSDQAYPLLDTRVRLSRAGIDRYHIFLEFANRWDKKMIDLNIYIEPPDLVGGPKRYYMIELAPGDSNEIALTGPSGLERRLFEEEPGREITLRSFCHDEAGNRIDLPLYKFTLGQLKQEFDQRRRLPRR
jgi:hypothetical protein